MEISRILLLLNTTNAPITATITVTPSANGCTGTPVTYTITVNPIPTVNTNANEVVCNGAAVAAINFSSPVTGTSYAWTNNQPSIGLPAAGNSDINSFTGINNMNAPITAHISVTPSANNCTGAPINVISITVNPTPTVNVAGSNITVCNGAAVPAINFTSSVSRSS
jgi:hypothetical protein